MAMSMLTDIWATTFILGDPTLARLISATMVRWSLEHGNAAESAYGYVTHAITVGPVRGDYERAYHFGRLALAVNERFDDTRRRAKIYEQFHAHVNFWRRPFATCIPYAREACRSGLEERRLPLRRVRRRDRNLFCDHRDAGSGGSSFATTSPRWRSSRS